MKIAVIDMDSILYSAFVPNKVADSLTGEPMKEDGKFVYTPKTDDEIKAALDGIMYHIFHEGGFTHYVGFVKGNNTINDRLEFNPEYKQQRTKEVPEKWEFTKQYAIEKWGVVEVNDIEVDDAVRITNINIPNSHIVAIDKDLLWQAGNNFNWRKNEWNSVTKQEEEEFLSRSLICGDTVDNLKGIPGKGDKWCDKNKIKYLSDALNAYVVEYGFGKGVDEFYRHFKCLYILESSDKFTKIPTPIEVPKIENNENKINRSRSSTGEF